MRSSHRLCSLRRISAFLSIRYVLSDVCTLTIAWRVFEDAPVLVAANRDEATDRPSTSPGYYRSEPPIIAPRDEEAGGTWIGYNAAGVFVGITNRWVDRPSGRSRGALVADCLAQDSAATAVEFVDRSVQTETYAGFNLVVADAETATLLEYDGTLSTRSLDPGVHVVVNVGADGAFFEPTDRPAVGRQQGKNAETLQSALQPHAGESADEWLERAGTALGDHDYGVCIHGDGFGTRSASLIRLGVPDVGLNDRYLFADGPPCETQFVEVAASIDST